MLCIEFSFHSVSHYLSVLICTLQIRTISGGTAADVKLCYTMREALLLLDFDDDSIADVKMLLLRAAFHPAFLQRPHGRMFLGYLYGLQAEFVKELAAAMKNQVCGHIDL